MGGWDAAGWVAVATAHVQAASKDRCRRKGGGREGGGGRFATRGGKLDGV